MSESLRISLIPPEGWSQIMLDPDSRESQIAAMLEPLSHIVAHWDNVYPTLRRYLIRVYEESWLSGVCYAITTSGSRGGLSKIMATFMVSVLPSANPLGDCEEELESIIETMTNEKESLPAGDELSLSVTRIGELGPAIQVSSIEAIHNSDGNVMGRMAMLRTFIPYKDKVVLTTGITPQIEIADTLFELFTQISSTMKIKPV